jgi:hypothetical protein
MPKIGSNVNRSFYRQSKLPKIPACSNALLRRVRECKTIPIIIPTLCTCQRGPPQQLRHLFRKFHNVQAVDSMSANLHASWDMQGRSCHDVSCLMRGTDPRHLGTSTPQLGEAYVAPHLDGPVLDSIIFCS